MNKKIILELERTREIMGLEIQNILTEQVVKASAEFVDDLFKLFSKGTSKATAKKYANKIATIIGKSSPKALQNVLKRMVSPKNTKSVDGVIVALVDSAGMTYKMSTINNIIKKVTNGTLGGKNLDFVLKQLPRELADGSGFRASFTRQMKNIEKDLIEKGGKEGIEKAEREAIEKAEREAAEKLEKEAIEKAEKEALEKGEKEAVETVETVTGTELDKIIADILAKNGSSKWYKNVWIDFKNLIFRRNVANDAILLRSNSFLKFLGEKNIKTVGELEVLLRKAYDNLGASAETKIFKDMDIDRMVREIAAVLEENSRRIAAGGKVKLLEIPKEIIDDVYKIILRGGGRDDLLNALNVAWVRRKVKDLMAKMNAKGVSEGQMKVWQEEIDVLMKRLIGAADDDVLVKEISEILSAKVSRVSAGGVARWTIRSGRNALIFFGGMTVTMFINAIVSAWYNQFGGAKALAGLTVDFYEKFRGHKYVIEKKGGLTDAQARKGAKMIKKYLQGWQLFRDWATESNFKDRLKEFCPDCKTLADMDSEQMERFWNETVEGAEIDDWLDIGINDAGFMKFFTGTADNAIVNFYEYYVPSILASSQITYFYEREGTKGNLLSDLDYMSSNMPFFIGTIINVLRTTKKDVLAELNKSTIPWIIGAGSAGDNFAMAVEEITSNWPKIPDYKFFKDGVQGYSLYTPGSYIPPGRLANITDENNYIVGHLDENTDAYQESEDVKTWINALTVEEFEDGFCADKDKCQVYATVEPETADKITGWDPDKVKTEITTILTRLMKEIQDTNIWNKWFSKGVQDAKESSDKVEIELNEPIKEIAKSPVDRLVLEGLINVLKNKN